MDTHQVIVIIQISMSKNGMLSITTFQFDENYFFQNFTLTVKPCDFTNKARLLKQEKQDLFYVILLKKLHSFSTTYFSTLARVRIIKNWTSIVIEGGLYCCHYSALYRRLLVSILHLLRIIIWRNGTWNNETVFKIFYFITKPPTNPNVLWMNNRWVKNSSFKFQVLFSSLKILQCTNI